jgi:antagonist of KipI
VLRFGARKTGARAYISVDGGIDVPHVLGSRATHLTSRLGGFQGRALQAGDRLSCGRPADGSRSTRVEPRAGIDVGKRSALRLRVLPGPHVHLLETTALERLQASRFTVSPQSDRMGYRLTADASLTTRDVGEMLSEPAVMGAVQVPPPGQPILLMADRQTTGGYPQVAVVISADLPLAAQLAPGDRVEFELCSRTTAVAALREYRGFDDGG